MTAKRALITRYPVTAYFVLTFAISWGGVLLVIGGPGGFAGTTALTDALFPLALVAMVAGPSIAGLLMTGLLHGKQGLRRTLSRLLEWRTDARWYAVALLAAPVIATTVLLAFSLLSTAFVPSIAAAEQKAAVLVFGLVVGMVAGLFEELGWTGFAIPELRRRHGVVATGLLVGVPWWAWHVLVVVWGIGNRAGTIPLALFVILDGLTFLPAFRVLMVWLFDRTANLLLAVLMHVSLTATTLVLWPVTAGGGLLIYDAAFAALVWVIVAAIAVISRGQVSKPAPHRQAA